METITKIDVRKMKEDIKAMVEEQRFYINQRKTVKLKGERKMKPSEAQWKHQANRQKLRLMYAAYGIARGKNFNQIENHYPEENHPLAQYQEEIDKILVPYKYEAQVEVVE